MKTNTEALSVEQFEDLLTILEQRFISNMDRHQAIEWDEVRLKLQSNLKKLWSLCEMERTGGEPDVIAYDPVTSEYVFCDCSPESPIGRRSLCYDQEAYESRKKDKPTSSASDMANAMGINMLTVEEYQALQLLGEFDTKTSSWVVTPIEMRRLGGALFCDRRYHRVFVYHNGAESYYAGRGFRGILRV